MSPPRPTQPSVRYFLRRRGQAVALGRARLAAGNAASAARTFREALAPDTKDPAAHLGLADALARVQVTRQIQEIVP